MIVTDSKYARRPPMAAVVCEAATATSSPERGFFDVLIERVPGQVTRQSARPTRQTQQGNL